MQIRRLLPLHYFPVKERKGLKEEKARASEHSKE